MKSTIFFAGIQYLFLARAKNRPIDLTSTGAESRVFISKMSKDVDIVYSFFAISKEDEVEVKERFDGRCVM